MSKVMLKRLFLIVLSGLVLSSCGPRQITLNTHSTPAGASIVQNGSIIGQDGQAYTYTVTDAHKKQGYIDIIPLKAKWPSGAESTPLTRLYLSTGYSQQITFQRPADAPNLSQDTTHGASVTEQRLRQQQIQEAQRQRNSAQSLKMMQYGLQMMQGNTPGYTGSSSSGTAFLKDEYTQGFNKICLYDRMGSVESLTLGATELCPLTK